MRASPSADIIELATGRGVFFATRWLWISAPGDRRTPRTEMNGRILIIRGGAIGDFILTLPVFAALRSQFPTAQLHLLGYSHVGQLALAGGLIDSVRAIESRTLAAFFARRGTMDPQWQDYFASFAVIVSYLYDPDEFFQANVARCSKAQFIVGPHRPDDAAKIHASDVLLKPLERLAVFDADPIARLTLPVSAVVTAPTLALHPGSGSERKNWPETNWAALLERLAGNTSAKLLLVGGEAEGERLERLAARCPASRVDVARNLPLVDLAARLAACRGFVGHDSGITHLAGALGLPGLALWGETAREVWAPRSPRVEILSGGKGLAGIDVETVVHAAQKLIEPPRKPA